MKVLLFLAFFFLSACTVPPVTQTNPTPAPSQPVQSLPTGVKAKLTWEMNHPEREIWTKALMSEIELHWPVISKATDFKQFYPCWNALNEEQKKVAFAEIIVGVVYYECSFNPDSAGVDVGQQNDFDTWSVGLMQLSAVDQKNYGFTFGYKWSELKDPIKNLHLGLAIADKLISQDKVITAGQSGAWKGMARYWSTIRSNRKLPAIINRVKAIPICK